VGLFTFPSCGCSFEAFYALFWVPSPLLSMYRGSSDSFSTFMETPSLESPFSIEVLANLPFAATDEQVLSLFTSDLFPYFLHFHSLTLIPYLFLANPFSDPILPLDGNAQFAYYSWGFHHFPARSATYAYSFMYLFHFCDSIGHKQLDIAYIAYYSLSEGEPSFIGGNYAQYLFEAPSCIFTSFITVYPTSPKTIKSN